MKKEKLPPQKRKTVDISVPAFHILEKAARNKRRNLKNYIEVLLETHALNLKVKEDAKKPTD